MRIAVIGGEHGEEGTDVVVDYLNRYPIRNVKQMVANPTACRLGKRWIDKNITHCYPGRPVGEAGSEEEWRAWCVMQWLSLVEPEVVLSIHSAFYDNEDAAYGHYDSDKNLPTTSCDAKVVAAYAGFPNIVHMSKPHTLQAHHKKAMSLDVSPNSPFWKVQDGIPNWYRTLSWLACEVELDDAYVPLMQTYVHRMTVTTSQKRNLGLPDRLPAFTQLEINPAVVGASRVALALSWGSLTGYSEVVEPLGAPGTLLYWTPPIERPEYRFGLRPHH